MGRLVISSEDAVATRLCFVENEQVELVRFTFLKWSLSHGRLDTYLVTSAAAEYEIVPPFGRRRQGERRGRRALHDDFGGFDIFEDHDDDEEHLAPHPQDPRINEEYDPLDELRELAEHLGGDAAEADEAAQVQPEEREDADEDQLPGGTADNEPGFADEDNGESAQEIALGAVKLARRPDSEAAPSGQGIYDAGSWHFRSRADGSDIGRISQLGAMSLKAVCQKHRSCSCIIGFPSAGSQRMVDITHRLGRAPIMADIEADLIAWLAEAEATTGVQHDAAGRTLRSESWRIKVRRQP